VSEWNEYFRNIISHEGTEMTFRTPLENLLNSKKPNSKIEIIHEPSREKGFGAPDFKVEINGTIIGYIETKALNANLEKELNTEQMSKYLELSNNIILTNYSEFLLIKNSKIAKRKSLFLLEDLKTPKKKLSKDKISRVEKLFRDFFRTEPEQIFKLEKLALELSKRGKILKEYIEEELKSKEEADYQVFLKGLYKSYKQTLIKDIKKKYFADAFTQTLIYGAVLARIANKKKIAVEHTVDFVPKSFPVIHELFKFFTLEEIPRHFSWIYEEIINVINNIDIQSIEKKLKFYGGSHVGEEYDPYFYFYEPFLKKFDAVQKKEKGVYYTPLPVVNFIVRSLDKILKKYFSLDGGFANEEVTTLDFACGTGTFLAEIFRLLLNQFKESRKSGQLRSLIKQHLLKHFYGFEYLIAPYAISHLKLSQLVEELGNYNLSTDDRLQIYLTDTLDPSEHEMQLMFPEISKEGEEANKIKTDKKILVITGNPPYSVHAQEGGRDWINKKLEYYKPKDERKIPTDVYKDFIRFAHYKMENINQGIIGIITNNSFLDGITSREMRHKLIIDFDEIYILNLHGQQEENTPSGETDENVFEISKVGVCITFFIKTGEHENCQLFYQDLYGTKEEKFKYLSEKDIGKIKWESLEYLEFEKEFQKTRWKDRFEHLNFFVPKRQISLIKNYGDYWGLKSIFKEDNSGVETRKDFLVIDYNSQNLSKRIKEVLESTDEEKIRDDYNLRDTSGWKLSTFKQASFKKENLLNYTYKPLDTRIVFYDKKALGRDRYSIMKHFINKDNVGIAYIRNDYSATIYNYITCSGNLIDRHLLGGQTFYAPLYLYEDNEGQLYQEKGSKYPNYSPDFQNFIKNKYSFDLSPEEIFGYIYAILHSPTYRNKYLELLKIDFPRIPFIDNEANFKDLSELGWELVQHHLMKKSYGKNISSYPKSRDKEPDKVDRIKTSTGDKAGTIRVGINEDQYFDNIPEEIWSFYIGGYQVLHKWLKYRRSDKKNLSFSEINHFHKMVNIIYFTIKQMEKIDNVVKDMPI